MPLPPLQQFVLRPHHTALSSTGHLSTVSEATLSSAGHSTSEGTSSRDDTGANGLLVGGSGQGALLGRLPPGLLQDSVSGTTAQSDPLFFARNSSPRVPALTDQASTSALRPALEAHRALGRCLLVDDDELNRRLGSRLLMKLGAVHVDTARDGVEAVEMAAAPSPTTRDADDGRPQRPRYDLVLLDIGLPGLRGDAACMELRRRGCRVPVVAITGEAAPGEVARLLGRGVGFDAVVPKPFGAASLAGGIAVARQRRAEVEEGASDGARSEQ